MSFALLIMLPAFVLPLLMPSWRWLSCCALVVGSYFAVMWAQHFIAAAMPGYNEGAGDAIGHAVFFWLTAGFVGGTGVRAVLLSQRPSEQSNISILINLLGFLLPFAVFAVPVTWNAWRLRPVTEVCATAKFTVEIASGRFSLPASSLVKIDVGRRQAYDLAFRPSLRALCSQTGDGRELLRAIRFRMELAMPFREPVRCDEAWGGGLCEPILAATPDDLPRYVDVFAPGETSEHSRGAVTEEAASASARADHHVTTRDVMTDGKPLTYGCTRTGDSYWCRTSYAWQQGVHVGYGFHASEAEIEARGLRADAAVKRLLSLLQQRD